MKAETLGIVGELKKKHRARLALARRALKRSGPKPARHIARYSPDIVLFQKWASRIGKGWYGFSLGHIPPVWTDMLDEFLSWLETQCPDFEIRQIKMKLGGVRIYVGTKTELVIRDEKICAEIHQLENLLRLPGWSPAPIRATRKKCRTKSRKP